MALFYEQTKERIMPNVLDRVAEIGVVPVIAIDSVSHALPLADALLAGGLPVAEITFRTDAAAEVIRLLSRERPDLIVGAGTVLSPETMKTAHAAGATFAVAPGLNPRVAQAAQELGMPFVPGIANPSDIEAGLDLGCRLLKFFPAEALGGVKLLTALSAPYRHTGVRFMPTGGVTTANLADYLGLPAVAAVGGTWIAKKEEMAAGAWEAVAQRCRDARAVVRQVRG
jgi:2-dehydro-3-deoxyphosphogluconate aldolase/(4S)-4-hydroxy-2-oxoglutarate aldolase